MLTKLFNLSYNTLKDAFEYLGGKLENLKNQIRSTVDRDIIQCLNV